MAKPSKQQIAPSPPSKDIALNVESMGQSPKLPLHRRSSINDIVVAALGIEPQTSTIISLKSQSLPLETAYNNYDTHIQKVYGANGSVFELSVTELEVFFKGQCVALGLSTADVAQLKCRILRGLAEIKKERDPLAMLYVFADLLIFEIDFITDLMSILQYASIGRTGIAYIMGGILAFSLTIQCVMSLVLGQSLLIALSGLVGMKPLVEVW